MLYLFRSIALTHTNITQDHLLIDSFIVIIHHHLFTHIITRLINHSIPNLLYCSINPSTSLMVVIIFATSSSHTFAFCSYNCISSFTAFTAYFCSISTNSPVFTRITTLSSTLCDYDRICTFCPCCRCCCRGRLAAWWGCEG